MFCKQFNSTYIDQGQAKRRGTGSQKNTNFNQGYEFGIDPWICISDRFLAGTLRNLSPQCNVEGVFLAPHYLGNLVTNQPTNFVRLRLTIVYHGCTNDQTMSTSTWD